MCDSRRTKGLHRSKRNFKKRFGNDHLVASRLINQLRGGSDIRTPVEMQKLSDDVKNAYMIFESMRQLDEVDTQRTVI